VNVEITQQSFFDLLNEADKEGTAYSFVRRAPVNKATGEQHVSLVSKELGLVIAVDLKNPVPVYFLKINS
jgi:hypothetical protein